MELQNMSVNDGEGIRTNLFLAGCPLRCLWCCNPEGQNLENSMTRLMDEEEIVQAVSRQLPFYRTSRGGITFSGGECTQQADFFRALAARFYDMGLSLAMESCGLFHFEAILDILLKMDTIFLDLKFMDPEKHRAFTGQDNGPILANIRKVYALGVELVLRIPLILGVNADEGNLRASFAFMQEAVPKAGLEFLPYHRYGEGKYAKLGRALPPADFQTPDATYIARYTTIAKEEYGIRVVSFR